MRNGLLDKLTNFFLAVDSFEDEQRDDAVIIQKTKTPHLTLHTPAELKIFVSSPRQYSDSLLCADHLKLNQAVLVNLEYVDVNIQQSISDFLNGVCYANNGSVQRASDSVILYVPAGVEVNKELYAYSVPTYVKP